jgi:predicted DNA-binding protein
VSATSEEAKSDRLTLRLPGRELERLRELARQRQMEVAALAREAISAYLDGIEPQAAHERLSQELQGAMRTEANRVIERHEQTMRALIAALNEHLAERPAGKR